MQSHFLLIKLSLHQDQVTKSNSLLINHKIQILLKQLYQKNPILLKIKDYTSRLENKFPIINNVMILLKKIYASKTNSYHDM